MKGLAVGLNKGFLTTKSATIRERAVLRKGTLGKRTGLVRKIVRECTGFAPYEKRVYFLYKVMELIKTGIAKDYKKALKLSKKRLGTHRRAMNKRSEMEEVIRQQRKK